MIAAPLTKYRSWTKFRNDYDILNGLLGRDFEIDLGGRTRYSSEQDSAEDPLFSWLSDELKERKTYSTFMKLMDNYS